MSRVPVFPSISVRLSRQATASTLWPLNVIGWRYLFCAANRQPFTSGRGFDARDLILRGHHDQLMKELLFHLGERFLSLSAMEGETHRVRLNAIEIAMLMFSLRAGNKLVRHGHEAGPQGYDPAKVHRLLYHLENLRRRAKRRWLASEVAPSYYVMQEKWRKFLRWIRLNLISCPCGYSLPTARRRQRAYVNLGVRMAEEILRKEGLPKSEEKTLRLHVRAFLRSVRREREGTTIGSVIHEGASARCALREFLLRRLCPVKKTRFN